MALDDYTPPPRAIGVGHFLCHESQAADTIGRRSGLCIDAQDGGVYIDGVSWGSNGTAQCFIRVQAPPLTDALLVNIESVSGWWRDAKGNWQFFQRQAAPIGIDRGDAPNTQFRGGWFAVLVTSEPHVIGSAAAASPRTSPFNFQPGLYIPPGFSFAVGGPSDTAFQVSVVGRFAEFVYD